MHEGSYEQHVVFTLHKLKDECLELCQERMCNRNIILYVDSLSLEQKISDKYVKLLLIIVNLLNDAIDAVTTSQDSWIRLEIFLKGQELDVAVEDSGAGIPEHLRDRIKLNFFTSMLDGIIRDMDGDFFLDTKASHTRFWERFPRAQVITEP